MDEVEGFLEVVDGFLEVVDEVEVCLRELGKVELEVCLELVAVAVEEELDMDDTGFPRPQGPVLTIVVFMPPIVPSLVSVISSQKPGRTIF